MKNVGLLGGTFDPVHRGHLELADNAIEKCGLNQVIFIPAAVPPHKLKKEISPFHHRVEMLKLALEKRNNFLVSEVEASLPIPSYTIDTLVKLHSSKQPSEEFYFITGIDAFLDITSWKNYRKVLESVHFIVSSRPGYDAQQLELCMTKLHYSYKKNFWNNTSTGMNVYYMDGDIADVSSSAIRSALHNYGYTGNMVSYKVMEYIKKNRLYVKSV